MNATLRDIYRVVFKRDSFVVRSREAEGMIFTHAPVLPKAPPPAPYPDTRIRITQHARIRMEQRIGMRPHKVAMLARKAWVKGVEMNESNARLMRIQNKGEYFHAKNRKCKEIMGHVFIFAVEGHRKTLVTVI